MLVAVDSVTPTIFVILEHGELLRWFDCADYMREPSDIAVAGTDFYVCDFKVCRHSLSLHLSINCLFQGHNVVVFTEEGQFLRRIGCENITNFPNGIDISGMMISVAVISVVNGSSLSQMLEIF